MYIYIYMYIYICIYIYIHIYTNIQCHTKTYFPIIAILSVWAPKY